MGRGRDSTTGLRDKEVRGEAMTTEERNDKWIYDAIRLWGVEAEVVDATFYAQFIGPFTMANRRAVFNLHYSARRMAMAAVNSVEDNREELVRFLGSMCNDGQDTNINLYKTKVITFYRRLINAQSVLTAVLHFARACVPVFAHGSSCPRHHFHRVYGCPRADVATPPKDKGLSIVELLGQDELGFFV